MAELEKWWEIWQRDVPEEELRVGIIGPQPLCFSSLENARSGVEFLIKGLPPTIAAAPALVNFKLSV
jgi:hypothetical protein